MHTDLDPSAPEAPALPQPIAPAWHAIAFLVLLCAWGAFGFMRTHGTLPSPSRITSYLTTIIFQWMTVGCVIAGLYHRKQTLSDLLLRARLGFFKELGIALTVLVAGFFVGGVVQGILHFTPLRHSADLAAVARILPQTKLEYCVWILVSLTAGFCEEFLFRGYLLKQFAAFTRNAYAGIILSSILFGAMHLYQGAAPAIAIAFLGMWLGIVAHHRKTIRSGIIAHSIQDILGGFLRSLLSHH